MTRDYLTVKVWDLNMENRPIETYQVSVAQPGVCSSGAPTGSPPEPHAGQGQEQRVHTCCVGALRL